MTERGLVSATLENEVITEVASRGLVFWLDKDAYYNGYVDQLVERSATGEFKYPVVAFRGSFLDVMLQLEDQGSALDPSQVIIHMPGFNEEQMRHTPLLELYRAGYRFRRSLDTLIRDAATGRVIQEDIDAYIKGDISLEAADEWLHRLVTDVRDGLSGYLDNTRAEDVIDGLLVRPSFPYSGFSKEREDDIEVLQAYLHKKVGMDKDWVAFISASIDGTRYDKLLESLAAWLMCVEYTDDLTGIEPYLPELKRLKLFPRQIVTECRERVSYLRSHAPDKYVEWADRIQSSHLIDELPNIQPENLGRIDTFRSEEERILRAAVDALAAEDWENAANWTKARSGGKSFWLGRDQQRRFAWTIVGDAAQLGFLLKENPRPLSGVTVFEDVVDRYKDAGAAVDQAHRNFEQRCADLLDTRIPHFSSLKSITRKLRGLYRNWADTMATDFSHLCAKRGFLPEASLQQRTIFEQAIKPLCDGKDKVAVFLVDALRYEMAAELLAEIQTDKTSTATLKARFAEIPSTTPVGMNVLAPVVTQGKLTFAGKKPFQGYMTGEFSVRSPADRSNAMATAAAGGKGLSLDLKVVCDTPESKLKNQVAQAKLVVVHSREIDDAGEAGFGVSMFSDILGQLRSAWHHLKAAGVKKFLFTTDHGFLLQTDQPNVRAWGKKGDASRRHVLCAEDRKESGTVSVALSELGYQGADGYLVFHEDTSVFDTGNKGANFVHGGNSPQERIIPVLTVSSRVARNVDLSTYDIILGEPDVVFGMNRIRLRLDVAKDETVALGFINSNSIDLAMRVKDRSDVKVRIREVSGGGAYRNGRLAVPVGKEWTEVFFTVEGPEDERVRIEVHHPDRVEQVNPATIDAWYDVLNAKDAGERDPSILPPEPPFQDEWIEALPDDGTQRIFAHLSEHGVITEVEATKMLGNPRKLRRFSSNFEKFLALTPLRVRIEQGADGKRYVKEG